MAVRGVRWALAVSLVLAGAWTAAAESPGGQSPAPPPSAIPSAPSFKVLADQVAGFFPVLETEVVEVAVRRVTLAAGRAQGVQPGLELTAFRQGRELYHPVTKTLLGRTEEVLGRLIVIEVHESYAVATFEPGDSASGRTDPGARGGTASELRPGDRVRAASGRVRLTVVTLASGARPRVVELASNSLVQELERTGRLQVAFGDQVAVWVAQRKIAPEEFVRGQGVREAMSRFGLTHLLVAHFTTVQGRPFMEVRLFSAALDPPLLQSALFVPPSIREQPTQQFSSGPGGPVRLERRSLLERLLSGDFEPNKYSASAASIPIRAVATFPFVVTSMDVAVGPADKVPRVVVTDGQRVFLYRLNNQVLEPEWTHDRLMAGQILSVQFAELTGDDTLEVVVNRQDVKSGMLSYILTTRDGRPVVLAQDIPLVLMAVDEKGEGVPRSLWGQKFDGEKLWVRNTAARYALKDRDVAPVSRVVVNDALRMPGARFSNIAGKDQRVVVFVDEQSRLRITSADGQELWRSSTPVGGGLAMIQTRTAMLQTLVDKFHRVEPPPLSVDLDGDGIEEVVVPINQDEGGKLAVIFRGPAGYRMQVVSSGFEGLVSGLGAIPGETGPLLVAAVVQRRGLLRTQGDTQIIMTVPE